MLSIGLHLACGDKTTRTLFPLVFLSGFAGLVYEVVWAEALALHFGNTAAAHAVVLGAFLGGMALGYGVIGAWSDRVENPLRFYGRLEIGIGLCGVIAPRIFAGTPGWASVLFLLIPTALMGGTLPPLVRAAAARGAATGEGIASLYSLNSAGAALGVLFAGFWAIPVLGIDLSGTAAATINILVGVAAFGFSGRGGTVVEAVPSAIKLSQARRLSLLGAVFISGFAALCYEIGWIRLLGLSLGASTYTFTVMLASFVAGVSIGGAVIRWAISRIKDPLKWFGALQLTIGLAVLASMPLYEHLPFIFHVLGARIPRTPGWYLAYEGAKFLFCFIVMLIPASLLGAALPVAADAESRSRSRLKFGAAIGTVFGLNTIGNVLGAGLAGLVLMPALGLRGLFCAAAMLNLIAGASVLLSRFAISCVLLGGAFAVFGGPWEMRGLVMGGYLYRPGTAASTAKEFRDFIRDNVEMLYYRDGANATVAVTRMSNITQLRINGKVDATDGSDMTTQALLSHIPLFLRPDAKDVLIVGLGSGVSVGAALVHPVRSVTVSEISPEVIEASNYFEEVNGSALKDSRVRLHVGDARSLLTRESKRYDAIMSEPSNPWLAGIGDLYTREFFQTARSRLNPDGLFVQWLHTYLMTDDDLRMVMRTIAAVFPNVEVWLLSRDILIVAGERKVPVPFHRLVERMEQESVQRSLASALTSSIASVLSLHLLDDAGVRRVAGWPGPINEDGFPLLEYSAPKGVFLGVRSQILEGEDSWFKPDPKRRLLLTQWVAYRGGLTPDEYESIFRYHWLLKTPFAGQILQHWAKVYPGEPRLEHHLKKFAEIAEKGGFHDRARLIRSLMVSPRE